jgi:DNA-directed RNA polymerase sigma subunit (sigma70/sigma32)
VLVRFKNSNAELAELVASGGSVRDALGVEVPQRRRRELTTMLDEFEACRHEFRLALFAVCLEEGATISEIGRALGVSRQRASRLVKEAAGATHSADGTLRAFVGVDGGLQEPK